MKSAFYHFFPSLRGLTEVWHHSYIDTVVFEVANLSTYNQATCIQATIFFPLQVRLASKVEKNNKKN